MSVLHRLERKRYFFFTSHCGVIQKMNCCRSQTCHAHSITLTPR
ncbi:hypothetical protein D6029_02510 [Buttiauxella izardii]|uniref:SCA7 domain-containing protein n=1 Tax=Buttiauxella izardii TaxID=82991 RepID=A0A3A5JXB1_9ENTR|nr:hypothetical protein D6029_02510 [Buttiauxella izardii]